MALSDGTTGSISTIFTSTPAALSSFLASQTFFTTSGVGFSFYPSPSAASFVQSSSTRTSNHTSSHTSTMNAQKALPTSTSKAGTETSIGVAVGGSVGGIVLLAFVIGFIVMRRRKRRKALAATGEPYEKPELHSNDYQPHREELLGILGKKQYDHTTMSELTSNEPVPKTKELPANEEVDTELDNRVKAPKKNLSSQSTKSDSNLAQERTVQFQVA